MTSSTTLPYTCDICGRSFARPQALGKHRVMSHGTKPAGRLDRPAPAPAFVSEVAADLDRQARELAASFTPRLAELDREIDVKLGEVARLKTERREVESALRRLGGMNSKPGPKSQQAKAGGLGVAAKEQAKLDNTRRYVIEHADELGEGFTASALTERMKAANVKPTASPSKVLRYVEQLRDEGVVRADRVVKGGGMLFRVTANGSSDG
jgi:hypothetical protein